MLIIINIAEIEIILEYIIKRITIFIGSNNVLLHIALSIGESPILSSGINSTKKQCP